MRFHVGFSFRPKNIIKFLIPILIGLGAYFGFPSLFGYIQVKAEEDFTSTYTLNLVDLPLNLSYLSDGINNITYKDFYDSLIEMDSDYYNLIIAYSTDDYSITTNLWLVPKATQYLDLNVYGSGNDFSIISNITLNRYKISYNSLINSSNTVYSAFLSCYIDNTDCNVLPSYSNDFSQRNTLQLYNYYYDDIFSSYVDYTIDIKDYIYYSSVDLVYSPDDTDDSSFILKSLVVEDISVAIGDVIPSYAVINDLLPDEPIPPEPSDSTIVDSIYWFTDNFTEYEVLVNIYVLLFLYCFATIILKLLMIVKGVKW